MRRLWCDACIVGGGPAGSSAAIRLRQIGLEVVVIERAQFPRRKIGESLAPSILPLLDVLGVREQVESAGFPRPVGATVRWHGDVRFISRASHHGEGGLQADRAVFDHILLNFAFQKGARVLMPALAVSARYDKCWTVSASTQEGNIEITCRYLLDGAGRRGFLKHARRTRLMPSTLALFAYWTDHNLHSSETRVEAFSDGWFWAAPLSNDQANIAVFIDPKGRTLTQGDLERPYRALLSRSLLLRRCLEGCMVSPVIGCDAAANMAQEPIGEGYVRLGDAAMCIDPLAGQGTHLAIMMGLQAAAVTNTVLSTPTCREIAEQFYRNQVARWAQHFSAISAEFYAERAEVDPSTFWTTRAHGFPSIGNPPRAATTTKDLDPDTRLFWSTNAQFTIAGILIKDRIEEALVIFCRVGDRSIAFLGGVPVRQVAEHLLEPGRAYQIAARLVPYMGERAAVETVLKLWQFRVLATDESERENHKIIVPTQPLMGVAN
ncbi:NAD(P)/FAD-dependent oxidoreductase [Mesorhizobium sp. CO1-1-11]|nr:NAD(P)/FAD-dependent oxidoreductase [Mesorhizobium sp. CO1-1-11]